MRIYLVINKQVKSKKLRTEKLIHEYRLLILILLPWCFCNFECDHNFENNKFQEHLTASRRLSLHSIMKQTWLGWYAFSDIGKHVQKSTWLCIYVMNVASWTLSKKKVFLESYYIKISLTNQYKTMTQRATGLGHNHLQRALYNGIMVHKLLPKHSYSFTKK